VLVEPSPTFSSFQPWVIAIALPICAGAEYDICDVIGWFSLRNDCNEFEVGSRKAIFTEISLIEPQDRVSTFGGG
jgi:hypothetical protein